MQTIYHSHVSQDRVPIIAVFVPIALLGASFPLFTAEAQPAGAFRDGVLRLGAGISGDRASPPCFTEASIKAAQESASAKPKGERILPSGAPGAGESRNYFIENGRYFESRVEKVEDLYSHLGVSAAFAARSMALKAQGSASFFSSEKFSDRSLNWLVDARYETQDELLDLGKLEFSHEIKGKLEKNDLAGFRDACGTNFVYGLRRGARYSMVYSFKSSTRETMKQLVGSVRAKYTGLTSYEGTLAVSVAINAAQRNSAFECSLYQEGDPGINRCADSPETLDTALNGLKDRLKRGEAPVSRVYVWTYEYFESVSKLARLKKTGMNIDARLEEMMVDLSDAEKHIAQIKALQDDADGPEPLVEFLEQKRACLSKSRSDLERYVREQKAQIAECVQDGISKCKKINPPQVEPTCLEPDVDNRGRFGAWSIEMRPIPDTRLSQNYKCTINDFPGGSDAAVLELTGEWTKKRVRFEEVGANLSRIRLLTDDIGDPGSVYVHARSGNCGDSNSANRHQFRKVGSLILIAGSDSEVGSHVPAVCASPDDRCDFRAIVRGKHAALPVPKTTLILRLLDEFGYPEAGAIFRWQVCAEKKCLLD
jgi:hypothetical protein